MKARRAVRLKVRRESRALLYQYASGDWTGCVNARTKPWLEPGARLKNVILCCDGTANEFSQDRTNVVKLLATLVQDPAAQAVYYHPGLGTMEPPGALTRPGGWMMRVLGQAVGYGLPADIRDAYVFLMNNFEKGDQLFMFGFSRRAYTVRGAAPRLHVAGRLPRGNEPLVPYAIRMLAAINRSSTPEDRARYFGLAAEFKASFGQLRE